jgi:hypothetical protein
MRRHGRRRQKTPAPDPTKIGLHQSRAISAARLLFHRLIFDADHFRGHSAWLNSPVGRCSPNAQSENGQNPLSSALSFNSVQRGQCVAINIQRRHAKIMRAPASLMYRTILGLVMSQ